MKTILYNTSSNKLLGNVREGSYAGIWDSSISQIVGWFPIYIVELEVVENEAPIFDEVQQYVTSEWITNVQELTYSLLLGLQFF